MKIPILLLALCLGTTWLRAEGSLTLTSKGVRCDVESIGSFTLGIPALDGRGTHLAPIPSRTQTDGKTLTAIYGPPFDDVTLAAKILAGGQVEYTFDHLPPDLHLAMCGFNLPVESLVPETTVTFDGGTPKTIPAVAGKTNEEVILASLHARKVEIKWPSGASLNLTASGTCWFGLQDARVWAKKYINVCLTPPLRRDVPGGEKSTFVLSLSVVPPPVP